MIHTVKLSNNVKKQLKKLPKYIVIKMLAWVDDIEARGLEEVRKTPGYHDEPLKGKRKGQRSVRLTKGYRAFYVVNSDGSVEFVEVTEVNLHEY